MTSPDELWSLNPINAIYYQFIAENGSTLSNVDALHTVKRDGCHYASARWVDNHWSLILWKLAGEVLAKPELFESKWSWREIVVQLKYRFVFRAFAACFNDTTSRYEREFGAAQRPVLRRIQEHDSSPGLPMVLCVSAIHRPSQISQTEDDNGNPVAALEYFELTDGWYRINAQIDDCLARAIGKGKIAVGRKLAVAGAKVPGLHPP